MANGAQECGLKPPEPRRPAGGPPHDNRASLAWRSIIHELQPHLRLFLSSRRCPRNRPYRSFTSGPRARRGRVMQHPGAKAGATCTAPPPKRPANAQKGAGCYRNATLDNERSAPARLRRAFREKSPKAARDRRLSALTADRWARDQPKPRKLRWKRSRRKVVGQSFNHTSASLCRHATPAQP